jgi:hypothetical protein
MDTEQMMARLLAAVRTNHEEIRNNQERMEDTMEAMQEEQDANLKDMRARQEYLT